MSQWYRVFGKSEAAPGPARLLEFLCEEHADATGDFRGDEQGWFAARLKLGSQIIVLDRYLSEEEGLRGELNSWAAWVEQTGHAEAARLMQQLISTRQLFTLHAEEDETAAASLRRLARWLAAQTDGVMQIDDEGFLTPEGTLLLPE
ncbi:MAG: hypothetical protein AB7K24_09200 [Gemmataceae bacterium]